MKTWIKVTGCIVLSFMICFISLGYASLSDTLLVKGEAEVSIPDGLFITAVEEDVDGVVGKTSNLDTRAAEHLDYTTTVDCTLNRGSSRAVGKVTYKITVLNNTNRTYAYRKLYYQSSLANYNGNSIIRDSGGNSYIQITTKFPDGEVVEPKGTLVFYATYTMGRSVNANTTYRTLVNFQFGINVNSLEEARVAVVSKFEDILNTPSTYNTLCDKIDDKFSGAEWTSNYIGNVTASTSTDSTTVNTLFAGHLQMVINGEDNPITVLIKHENVDNNRNTGDDYTAVSGNSSFTGYGCEFTLYMTTSNLSQTGGKAPVYAAVFTCDRDENGNIIGKWHMVGEHYEGTADIVGYEGGASNGSFDTGTWRAVQATYSPAEHYSYTVSQGSTIQNVTQAVDPRAASVLASLLTEAKAILDENKYAGTGMVALEEAYYNNAKFYTVAENGTITVDPTAPRVRLIPVIQDMELALKAFDHVEK